MKTPARRFTVNTETTLLRKPYDFHARVLLVIIALKFTFSFFSQVVEKTEHADLWLEVMTLSGTEALFDLLTSSNPALQQTVLCAIKNLAAHPKMARLFIDYGLESVTELLSCKVESYLIIFIGFLLS